MNATKPPTIDAISEHPAEVTGLLLEWGQGDDAALARLIPLVHEELQPIARRYMAGEAQGHSLQADDALNELATFDERKSRVIELRFFGGLSVEETAAVLRVSPDTVRRDWRLAKAWLSRELRGR